MTPCEAIYECSFVTVIHNNLQKGWSCQDLKTLTMYILKPVRSDTFCNVVIKNLLKITPKMW